MLNISNEQEVNQALNLCELGGRAAFHLGAWIQKHSAKISAETTLLENATSYFRGGHYTAGETEMRELIHDLAGTDDARLDGNFVWLGDRSDLSVFWRKTDAKHHTTVAQSAIDSLDEKLRAKVKKTLSAARVDGLIGFNPTDGKWTLTDKGKNYILRPAFVTQRLEKECKALGIAAVVLNDAAKDELNDRINRRLSELGLEGKYDGCDRITLNKEMLYLGSDDTDHRFYLPGTKRKEQVFIPKDDVIELDDKTYAAFLRPKETYTVSGAAFPTLSGTELFRHFDNKNKDQDQNQKTTVSAARGERKAAATVERKAAAPVERQKPSVSVGRSPASPANSFSSFNTNDFFRAALEKSYGKDFFVDCDITEGETRFIPTFHGAQAEIKEFVFTRRWQRSDGDLLNFHSVDGSEGDILVPEAAIGSYAATTREAAEEYLKDHSGEAKEYWNTISSGFSEAEKEADEKVTVFELNNFSVTKRGDGDFYSVSSRQTPWESVKIPAGDIRDAGDKAVATIRSAADYTVSIGGVEHTASARAVSEMLTGGGAKAAAKTAAKTAAATTAKAAMTTVSAAIPPVDGVTAAAKLVTQAAAGAVEQGAQALDEQLSESQSLSLKL